MKRTRVKEISFFYTAGIPIAGTGAGLRPIGQDPNFVADFREIFNISVPILDNEEEIDQVDYHLTLVTVVWRWNEPNVV